MYSFQLSAIWPESFSGAHIGNNPVSAGRPDIADDGMMCRFVALSAADDDEQPPRPPVPS
jgi:hypothetical protein